ncbi:MAG: FAD-dependent oxidoreductase, partial [Chloroflexi bacterium]|nr:FAD-dependent oxidoreductase [Chloroflexota bacterium]
MERGGCLPGRKSCGTGCALTNVSDVIVVGGGAAGASVAYELVKRGVSATIIERDSIAS